MAHLEHFVANRCQQAQSLCRRLGMITDAALSTSGEDKLASTKRHKMSKEIYVYGT